MRYLISPLCALAFMACGAEDSPTPAESGFDETAALDQARAFKTSGFAQVNGDPIQSTQHATNQINVWVSDSAKAAYLGLDPDDPNSTAVFEAGDQLVKEHLNDDGTPNGLTVMTKAPAGSAPETGDWFWARIENSGAASFSGFEGKIDFCIGCHTPAKANDWCFGVHKADRAK